MDTLVVCIVMVITMVFHPVRTMREILVCGRKLLFGDKELLRSTMWMPQMYATPQRSEVVDINQFLHCRQRHEDLQFRWERASAQERESLIPLIASLAEECRVFNASISPNSPFYLRFWKCLWGGRGTPRPPFPFTQIFIRLMGWVYL